MEPLRYVPLGYVQMTLITPAAGLTSIPTGANAALLQAETQDVRLRDDGTAPTATVGMLLKAGAVPFMYQGNLAAVQVILATAGAILNILYYKIAG